jgi:hypothetical protein
MHVARPAVSQSPARFIGIGLFLLVFLVSFGAMLALIVVRV